MAFVENMPDQRLRKALIPIAIGIGSVSASRQKMNASCGEQHVGYITDYPVFIMKT